MPQETKTSEYWDSVHRALRIQAMEYQERTKASNLAHEKWRDSMEALNGVHNTSLRQSYLPPKLSIISFL
jgi:hypothetical protein